MTNASWQHEGLGGSGADPARPGAVFPLRRMTLGEVFGAGFAMLRHSPRTMLGIPLAAAAANLLLSLAISLIPSVREFQRFVWDPSVQEQAATGASPLEVPFSATAIVVMMGIGIVQNLLLYLSFAALAVPVFRAAYGYQTSFAHVAHAGRQRAPQLTLQMIINGIGVFLVMAVAMIAAVVFMVLTLFIGAIVVIPALILLVTWVSAALLFSPFAVVVEGRGPLQAIGRSWALNRGRWWRHIGTLLLLYLMAAAASVVVMIPMLLISGLMSSATEGGGAGSTVAMVVTMVLEMGVAALFTAVFAGCAAVMMLNARFEQEGLDVVLLAKAEGAHDDGMVVPGSAEHVPEAGPFRPGASGGTPMPNAWQNPYGGNPYGGNSYDGNSYSGNPYGQPPQGQSPYGQPPYGQNPYGQNPYGSHPSDGGSWGGPSSDGPRSDDPRPR